MTNRAFTLVELVIAVTIFVIMTSLLMARYGNFNQNVLLTNLAYDVSVTLRTAQTYGLSIKNISENVLVPDVVEIASGFQNAYGVHFEKDSDEFVLFSTPSGSSANANNTYEGDTNSGDTEINKYFLKRGAKISGFCVGIGPGNGCSSDVQELDITFKRPNPNAIICKQLNAGTINCSSDDTYAEIYIKGTDDSIRTVIVRNNGQISVKD